MFCIRKTHKKTIRFLLFLRRRLLVLVLKNERIPSVAIRRRDQNESSGTDITRICVREKRTGIIRRARIQGKGQEKRKKERKRHREQTVVDEKHRQKGYTGRESINKAISQVSGCQYSSLQQNPRDPRCSVNISYRDFLHSPLPLLRKTHLHDAFQLQHKG